MPENSLLSAPKPFFRIIQALTGAKSGEVIKTFASFTALFLLLTSYYMVKPLRNSEFMDAFHSDFYQQIFFLMTAIVSIIVTKIFSSFYGKVSNFNLIVGTYIVIMACKFIFHFYLPAGGKPAIVIFYVWASVYFLLAIAILWGCINLIFSSEEGERCYGFIAVGAMLGGIAGSYVSGLFSKGALFQYALLISALVMASVLFFIHMAMRFNNTPPRESKETPKLPSEDKVKQGFFSDFSDLWGNRYVRSIGVMIYAIAAFNTVLEFQSFKMIDQQTSIEIYNQEFQTLNQLLNAKAGLPEKDFNQTGFDFVFQLKSFDKEQYLEQINLFIQQQTLNLKAEDLLSTYQNFKDQKKRRVSGLYSNIYFYQGILGISLLVLVSRFLFQRMGVRFTIMILPSFYTLVIISLFFPVGLLAMETFLVVGYGLSYSLNRATKELLYTQTSDSTIFRLKPLIDGPVRRLGDLTMAIFKLVILWLVVSLLSGPAARAEQIFLSTALLILGFWIYSVWYVGGQYDKMKKNQ